MCQDGSLWLDGNNPENIQHINLSDDKISVLSAFDINSYGLAISPTGSTFIVGGGSTLKIINEKTGQLIDTKFSIHPWTLTCVYVTKKKNIILGGFIRGGKGCVVVLNNNGKELQRYEKDKDKSIATYPRRIETTCNGNMIILDGRPSDKTGGVVVIKQGGDIVYYNGHPDINSDYKPFRPVGVLVTPRDNVIIINLKTYYIHILSNGGDFITYYNMTDIGVIRPFSMALSPSRSMYIGSVSSVKDPPDSKATLYEIEYYGV